MPQYRPKVNCTHRNCLLEKCPIYDLGFGETIIGEVLGKGLKSRRMTRGDTQTQTYVTDGTKVIITVYGNITPGICGFQIRTDGPYGDKHLEELKDRVIQDIPKIEIKDRRPYKTRSKDK